MILHTDLLLTRAAEYSACGTYRYRLRYVLGGRQGCVLEPPRAPVAFGMLNPSYASERAPDRTISRCIDFGRAWGFSDLFVFNAFALVSTDPRALLTHPDPVGPENDAVLAAIPASVPVIAAWGNHRALAARVPAVLRLLARPLLCLATNDDGSPRHPLSRGRGRIPNEARPAPWAPRKDSPQ